MDVVEEFTFSVWSRTRRATKLHGRACAFPRFLGDVDLTVVRVQYWVSIVLLLLMIDADVGPWMVAVWVVCDTLASGYKVSSVGIRYAPPNDLPPAYSCLHDSASQASRLLSRC